MLKFLRSLFVNRVLQTGKMNSDADAGADIPPTLSLYDDIEYEILNVDSPAERPPANVIETTNDALQSPNDDAVLLNMIEFLESQDPIYSGCDNLHNHVSVPVETEMSENPTCANADNLLPHPESLTVESEVSANTTRAISDYLINPESPFCRSRIPENPSFNSSTKNCSTGDCKPISQPFADQMEELFGTISDDDSGVESDKSPPTEPEFNALKTNVQALISEFEVVSAEVESTKSEWKASKPPDNKNSTLKDSSSEGSNVANTSLKLEIMPCEVVIPPLPLKYRHLCSPKIRKPSTPPASASLKKRICSGLEDYIPLGAKRAADNRNSGALKDEAASSPPAKKQKTPDKGGIPKPKFCLKSKYGDVLTKEGRLMSNSSKNQSKLLTKGKLDKKKMVKRMGFPYTEHSYHTSKPVKTENQLTVAPKVTSNQQSQRHSNSESKSPHRRRELNSKSNSKSHRKSSPKSNSKSNSKPNHKPSPPSNFKSLQASSRQLSKPSDQPKSVSNQAPKSVPTQTQKPVLSQASKSSSSNKPTPEAVFKLEPTLVATENMPRELYVLDDVIINKIVERAVAQMNVGNEKKLQSECKRKDEKKLRDEKPTTILKNKSLGNQRRKVTFSREHSFGIIDCSIDETHFYDLFLERADYLKIMMRQTDECERGKLSVLKWINHRWTNSISEEECDEKDSPLAVENILRRCIYLQMRKSIDEIDRSPQNTGEAEFSINSFDSNDKQCWKLLLKLEVNSADQKIKFAVGDIVSLNLKMKYVDGLSCWKPQFIFGYVEEVRIKIIAGGKEFQILVVSIGPIDYEVNFEDFVKVRALINIRHYLRLLEALPSVAHSPLTNLLYDSSPPKSNFGDEQDNSNFEVWNKALKSGFDAIMSSKPSLLFLYGAPGTGKSQYLVELIDKLCPEMPKLYSLKILVITRSDGTADDICHRLSKLKINNGINLNFLRYCGPKQVVQSLEKYTLSDTNCLLSLPNLCFDAELEARLSQAAENSKKMVCTDVSEESCESTFSIKDVSTGGIGKTTDNGLKSVFERQLILSNADVVVISRRACYEEDFRKDFTPLLSNNGMFHKFSVCIIDDANEMNETDIIIPIMTLASNLVLIGDNKNASSMDTSVFNRNLERYEKTCPKNVINLKTQLRMSAKILECVGTLKREMNHSITNSSPSHFILKPLLIIDFCCPENALDCTQILYEKQAKFCKIIVENIQKLKSLKNVGLGILVGKKKQKTEIEKLTFGSQILVEKAKNFGGLEREVIVVCVPQMIKPEEFLYATMTRARRTLIICGDFSVLKGQSIKEMIQFGKRRKCYQLWEEDPLSFPFKLLQYSR